MATATRAAKKQTSKESSVSKHLKSVREKRNLKNQATMKVGTKSDMIRSMFAKKMTPSEIQHSLEKKGYGVYPSEIYRVKNA